MQPIHKLTLGERAAERLTEISGAWMTVFLFTVILATYMTWNSYPGFRHFDPYPFEFMTFAVSIIANYQAMVVMISQKAQLRRDQHRADLTNAQMRLLVDMATAQQLVLEQLKRLAEEADKDMEAVINALEGEL